MSSSLETGNMNKNSPPRSRLGNAAYKVGGAVTGAAKGGYKVVHSVWDDFRNFIDKGNVVDLAVGKRRVDGLRRRV